MKNEFIPPYVPSIRVAPVSGTRKTGNGQGGDAFANVLSQVQNAHNASQPLRVSAHAQMRLRERGVHMTDEDWRKLGQAVVKAEEKGAKDAYVMYGQTGFVVNVKNRTVVTTMVGEEPSIITNIDSVVIVPRLDR